MKLSPYAPNRNPQLIQEASTLFRALAEGNVTLSTAESCTGGMISSALTSLEGISKSYVGGGILYSNALKTIIADVPERILIEHGAVSEETAAYMASGIAKRCQSDIGLSVTGIAGPGGATVNKPVGLVYIGISDGRITCVMRHIFEGQRDNIRLISAHAAMVYAIEFIKKQKK